MQKLATLLLTFAFISSALAQGQKPLTREQVYDLIAGGLDSKRVAKAVTQRGINFEPTEEYLSTLRAKGASQVLVDTLRAANPTPLSRPAIIHLLAAGTSDETLATIVQRRGLDFAASDQDLDTLRIAGAGPLLLKALREPPLVLRTAKLPETPTLIGPPDLKMPQMQLRQLGDGSAGGTGGGVYDVGGNVMAPVPIYDPNPPYSEEARKAKYSGTVSLIIIVDASGNVTDAQVIKPAGLGLDEKAVETVKTWKFNPAMRNGVPVRVRCSVEVSFRIPPSPGSTSRQPDSKPCAVPFTLAAAAWNDAHEMKWDWFGEDETYWWGRGGASKYPRLCVTNRQQAEFVIAWRTPSFPNFDGRDFRIEVFSVGHGEVGELFYISKNPSPLGAFKDALKHLQNQGK